MTTETLPAVRPAPLEPTTPIKPSEAIRLGCLIAPRQLFGAPRYEDAACAIGAMLLGLGRNVYRGVPKAAFGQTRLPCPATGFGSCENHVRARDRIVHLNDAHRWSRERIANWLEGLGL